jgi:uncharacterized membrane protein (DUF2068 family)
MKYLKEFSAIAAGAVFTAATFPVYLLFGRLGLAGMASLVIAITVTIALINVIRRRGKSSLGLRR